MMNFSQNIVCEMAEYARLNREEYKEPTDGHFPDAIWTIWNR